MAQGKSPRWISSTARAPWKWKTMPVSGVKASRNLALTGQRFQTIWGFGGCFNELGWLALRALPQPEIDKILRELYHPAAGCRFNFGRIPIGASDYAAQWYSCNEHDGDFAMRKFSIERDKEYLLPYIQRALAFRPDIRFFASPWSPPTWMKRPRVFNFGRFVMEKRYLEAYALYFRKFIEAYAREGVHIRQLHPQNEVLADQKFASCMWTGQNMAAFIGDYLGPCFEKAGLTTEIWLGTLNTNDFVLWPLTVLTNGRARRYIKGVGLQWGGRHQAGRLHQTFPQVPLMQTENECGDGKNTWEYAEYVFGLMHEYLSNSIHAYIYWNMILPPGGESTWGWRQNAMLTVDPAAKRVTYNPEFYHMKHLSHFVAPGAVRVGLQGDWSGTTLAFANPDESLVLVAQNPFDEPRPLNFDDRLKVALPARSLNTFVL
jgi:glucosylceramidase